MHLYEYPPLIPGILIKRYKRFLADVELETGEQITAHCANPGKMLGLSDPGIEVMVSRSDNPKRKLPYTLEIVRPQDNPRIWVGVNTNLPNRVIKVALKYRKFPELGDYTNIRPEVTYGQKLNSRVDFCLTAADGRAIYLEVKNVTWAVNRMALFPDAVTTRGQKHLQELAALAENNQARAVALYFINRSDCDSFAPGDAADAKYGELLRWAMTKGLEVLACRFQVCPTGIDYLGLAPIKLD